MAAWPFEILIGQRFLQPFDAQPKQTKGRDSQLQGRRQFTGRLRLENLHAELLDEPLRFRI